MKFGYFDDIAKEYVITRPDTPLPWINYLGNDGFFSLISNTCGGYSFYRDAKLRRITRFRYNNVPADFGGRCMYICDGDAVWSPGFMPVKTALDSYRCRHGLGYTVFEGEKNGLAGELTCLVPIGGDCELQRLTLTNRTNADKQIKLYSALEWCLWNAVDDSSNFQRNYNIGEVEVEDSVVYHKTEYRERSSHYAFYAVNQPISGFDTDRDAFLGQFRGWEMPAMVAARTSGGSIASGWAPMACLRLDATIRPGESRTYIFQLGYVENPEEEKFSSPGVINKTPAENMQQRFCNEQAFREALARLQTYWDELLCRFHVDSSDEKLNRMVNIWNQYQCMVTFNMSRSASYYESGTGRGMGFRDSC